MDYKKKYYELINTRKVLNRIKTPTDYFEKHHIVPLSLGGTNENDNLVLLTAKEHYIAHLLLVHCFYGKAKNKMIWALWGMQRKSKGQKRIMSASQYENARILFSNMVKNKIVSKETIQKRTKTRQENGWNKNPELTKKKQSEKGTKDFPKIAILNSIKTRQKAINQYDLNNNFIKEWESIKDASNKLKLNYNMISANCTSKIKAVSGFIFKYKINNGA